MSGRKQESFDDDVVDCFKMVSSVMTESVMRYGYEVATAATAEFLIALLAASDKSIREDACDETCAFIRDRVKRMGEEVDIITSLEPETMQ